MTETTVREDLLDFPTGWRIQEGGGLSHDERCSSVPGWHPLSGPHLLCDCDAVPAEWRRRVGEQMTAREATA